jgi:hypothetical protein
MTEVSSSAKRRASTDLPCPDHWSWTVMVLGRLVRRWAAISFPLRAVVQRMRARPPEAVTREVMASFDQARCFDRSSFPQSFVSRSGWM